MSSESTDSKLPKVAGLALTAAGVAHFVRPQLFEPMSKPLFPRNTRQHIYTNGGIETALGLGLLGARTRKLALIGGIGYLAVVYGYQRFDNHIMIATIVALIATIQLIQFLGDRLVNRLRHTQGNLV